MEFIDLMTNWQIYLLLASMLGGKNLKGNVEKANLSNCWAELLELSSHQMVTSQLGIILKNNSHAWKAVQTEEAAYLDEIVSLNAQRNVQLIQQTIEIIQALNKLNIVPLIMKGTAQLLLLEERYYGYRMQMDIDLLVHPSDMQQATQSLKKLGYQYSKEGENGLEPVPDELALSLLASYKQHKHLPPLVKDGARAAVELHRHLYSKRYQKYYDISEVFERSKLTNINKLSWHQLSFEDECQLLLTGGYIDPRLKPSFSLPLRLVRDYLDLKEHSDKNLLHSSDSCSAAALQKIPASLLTAQKEVEELILIISNHWPSNEKISPKVAKYLSQLESINKRPRAHKFAHNRAALTRKLINLAHNPRLLLKHLP